LLERGSGLLSASLQSDDDRVQSRMFGPNLGQRPQLLETRSNSNSSDRGGLSSPSVSAVSALPVVRPALSSEDNEEESRVSEVACS
jgi:hypothetical protein